MCLKYNADNERVRERCSLIIFRFRVNELSFTGNNVLRYFRREKTYDIHLSELFPENIY